MERKYAWHNYTKTDLKKVNDLADGYRSFREADPARQVAFEVLTLVRNEDAYANLVLPKVL